MKHLKWLFMMATACTFAACQSPQGGSAQDNGKAPVIEQQKMKIENGLMTPEALWAFGRIGGFSVAPNEERLAYTVSYYSVEHDKSDSQVFIVNTDGTDNRQITHDKFHVSNVEWLTENTLLYLSNESGSNQIWQMGVNGRSKKQVSDVEGDIEGFILSPDHSKILYIKQVKTVPTTADKYPDLPKATGRIVTDLMYKHWDEWVEGAPHPFVADLNNGKLENHRDILEGEPYESPMRPWGGTEQLAWSPDGKKVAYTCRKKTGLEYAVSTNSDIYVYDLEKQTTDNLTPENMGYDTNPQFSPDGRHLAWLSMERDGYESDLNRLFIVDLQTGERTFVSQALETNIDEFLWSADSKNLYGTAAWHGRKHVYQFGLGDSINVRQLTSGDYDFEGLALAKDRLVTKRHSMSAANEIYAVNTADTLITQLTHENQWLYDQLEMGRVEERWLATTDGKQMLTWVIYPPKFDPAKKYPTLLYCEGGPQTPLSQFWSYRWNFQIMAANGYIIVAPSRRGMPGFGKEWNEAISGDYTGQCMRDYLTAIDELCKEPFVDKDHLGCVGASFGGYSVYWLAGNHDKRFKAFIAHDGIFNMEMQYLETEEKWFANWDMGGAYWEKDNAVAQRTFATSPHKYVDKWDTPILCIHGEKDYRILANQAMAAFDAAKMRGVPAELLIYPNENHWVLHPQNGILWQRTFFEWLDKWLKVKE